METSKEEPDPGGGPEGRNGPERSGDQLQPRALRGGGSPGETGGGVSQIRQAVSRGLPVFPVPGRFTGIFSQFLGTCPCEFAVNP